MLPGRAEYPPPHKLVRKGRYVTILGRAGDSKIVTLEIIWRLFATIFSRDDITAAVSSSPEGSLVLRLGIR